MSPRVGGKGFLLGKFHPKFRPKWFHEGLKTALRSPGLNWNFGAETYLSNLQHIVFYAEILQ